MKKAITFIAVAACSQVSMAAANPIQYMVPGSQQKDFGIKCWDGVRETFSISSENRNNYRVARNIVFTEMGGGRVVMSYLHGSNSATASGTYLLAMTERCETFEK